MRNINLRYVEEEYDEKGILTKLNVKCPENFNFGYDIVDDIAINDPDRRAMLWCHENGEERTFTFGDIKKLKGVKEGYRLRVGDLRVLFSMEDDNIYVDNIIPRGQAYKKI